MGRNEGRQGRYPPKNYFTKLFEPCWNFGGSEGRGGRSIWKRVSGKPINWSSLKRALNFNCFTKGLERIQWWSQNPGRVFKLWGGQGGQSQEKSLQRHPSVQLQPCVPVRVSWSSRIRLHQCKLHQRWRMNVEKVFFKLLFLGASGSNAYIASQGPLPHTVNDFWRMVVEREVQVSSKLVTFPTCIVNSCCIAGYCYGLQRAGSWEA